MNLGEHGKGSHHMQVVAQWITSLAISIICCAILFIIFAGYIVQIHDQANLLSVKIEILQERNNFLVNEVANLRKGPLVQINTGTNTGVQVTPAENVVSPMEGQAVTIPATTTGTPPVNVGIAPQPQPVPVPAPEKNDIILPVDEPAPADIVVPEPKKEPAPKAKAKAPKESEQE